ncbi:MAG: TetR/AcrR family transcriptional regulator, partial [Actinobacteria bacterium]|nr:TetR/AcrR family transcriptional regulator [Actinomycetota bacterium]
MVRFEMAAPNVKKRRPSEEVHRLILEAARSLFAAKGYAGTSTREVAELAGVYEPMVYRRFGSKADLFEAAVLAPFNGVVSDYLAAWESQVEAPATVEELTRQFVEPLYDLLSEHRGLVLALIAAGIGADSDRDAAIPGLPELIERLEPQIEIEAVRRPLPGLDVPATLRVSIGMVIGMAILDRWLHNGDYGLSRDRVVEEMVRYCLYGAGARPGPDAGAGPAEPADPERIRAVLD